ncbi:MAG TPA: ABC transporter ATP-binding protein [Candidatus Saccharimonadales bacterium]
MRREPLQMGIVLAVHPLGYFAKQAFRSSLGKKAVFIAVVWGALNGSLLPLGVATFMGLIGTQQAMQLAQWLVALLIVVCLVNLWQHRLAAKAITGLKAKGRAIIAKDVSQCPPAHDNESTPTIVSRFLSAQQIAIWMLTTDAVNLVVSLSGFIAVLVLYGMPWWVYAVVGGAILFAFSAYWPIKNHTLFSQAGDLESRVGDLIAQLRSSRNNRQVQPALMREIEAANQKALEVRTASDLYTIKRFQDARTLMSTAICCVAILAGSMADTATAALLVVFMFSFSSHIENIHGLANRYDSFTTDSEPLLTIVGQPERPALRLLPDRLCLRARNVVVQYTSKNGDKKNVAIRALRLRAGGIYVFTGTNGSGKSSLFKAISAEAYYEGDLLLWGQQARSHDSSIAVVSFQQVRPKLSVPVKELFIDAANTFDDEAMSYAIWCVNGGDVDLDNLHDELSGGRRQKIDLALQIYRCLVEPEQIGLVVIDELSNHLDRPTVGLMKERLADFVTRRLRPSIAVMIATHDERLQEILLSLPHAEEVA